MAGNAKDVCVKEAKAVETGAKADAKVQMKTSQANATANEESADAHSKADAHWQAVSREQEAMETRRLIKR